MDVPFSRFLRVKAPLRGDTLPIMRRLWRDWVRPHRATILAILLFIALASGANALYPLLVREAFKALEARAFDDLRFAPLIVIAVTALKGGALLMIARLTNGFVSRVEADLQHALYCHLIDADLARLQRESTAALTQRFTTDFAYIREALTRLFTVLVRDLAMLVGLVAVLLYLDPWSTLVAGLVAPFVVPPIARIGKRLRRIAVATQEETGQMAARVSESLAGARTAKAFLLEPYLKDRARAAFEQIRDLKVKGANARARLEPILEAGAGVAVAAVIVFVGWRLETGEATLGDFAAYTGALLMAAQPARTIGNLNAIVQEALAALDRTFAVLDEGPTIRDRADARPLEIGQGATVFDAVRYSYEAERPALADVSVALTPGETTAIVGPSGSGKSTFLALLSRFIEPQAGRITIDGQDIAAVTLASLRETIALVSQDVALFDDTVAANIGFGKPGASAREIIAAATAAGAHGFISALPHGYQTRVGERGDRLSGGERQRIAIARAFLRDAPILLLDEATSALDAQSEDVVQAALGDLMRGRTTVVVAHRLSTVRHAAQILVFDAGRIVERGNHETLIAAGGLYADLCRRQFVA